MTKIVAVSFVSPMTQKMSALMANKLSNLNPVPDEIVFITPNIAALKTVHSVMLQTKIPCRYMSDAEVANIFKIDLDNNQLGWLNRQWVQLHLDLLIPNVTYILTCDSDLIVNRPLDLFTDGKINLFVETEHYEPYFTTIRTLLPELTDYLRIGESFKSDIMLLVPQQLRLLRIKMNTTYFNWLAISTNVRPNAIPAFSDYETIGTWMLNKAPDQIKLVRADTYNNNIQFAGKHNLSDLLKTKSVIPLRTVFDEDIDWFN